MKQSLIKRIFAWIFIVLLMSSAVIGLGIAPAEIKIPYYSGEHNFSLFIINNDKRDMNISLTAGDELAEFIRLPDSIEINSEEEKASFIASINIPEDISPGARKARIIATEDILDNDKNIAARLKVASGIIVDVPYPERYIDSNIIIEADNILEPITVQLVMNNKGSSEIENAKASIGLYDKDSLISSDEFEVEKISAGDKEILASSFSTNEMVPGVYTIKARIISPSFQDEVWKDFNLGKQSAEIYDFTQYFVKDEINEFKIDVKNGWNRKIKNVYADIEIEGFNSIKTLTYNLDPLEEKTLVSYWDTSDVPLGTYESKVILRYPNATIEKKGTVHVIEESEIAQYLGETSKKIDDDLIYMVLALILLILFIINLAIFYFRKRSKEKSRTKAREKYRSHKKKKEASKSEKIRKAKRQKNVKNKDFLERLTETYKHKKKETKKSKSSKSSKNIKEESILLPDRLKKNFGKKSKKISLRPKNTESIKIKEKEPINRPEKKEVILFKSKKSRKKEIKRNKRKNHKEFLDDLSGSYKFEDNRYNNDKKGKNRKQKSNSIPLVKSNKTKRNKSRKISLSSKKISSGIKDIKTGKINKYSGPKEKILFENQEKKNKPKKNKTSKKKRSKKKSKESLKSLKSTYKVSGGGRK